MVWYASALSPLPWCACPGVRAVRLRAAHSARTWHQLVPARAATIKLHPHMLPTCGSPFPAPGDEDAFEAFDHEADLSEEVEQPRELIDFMKLFEKVHGADCMVPHRLAGLRQRLIQSQAAQRTALC